jgi:hypothetical protein
MSQPVTVTLNGAVVAAPSASTTLVPSLGSNMMLGVQRTYSYKAADSGSINSPSAPVALQQGSITKIRYLSIRIIGAAVTVVAVSAAGTATFKLADLWVWHDPNEGDQFTSITLQGVTDFEYILLGD